MPQVVESQGLKPCRVTGTLEPAAEGRRIDPAPEAAREDVVVRPGEFAAPAEPIQGRGDLVGQRDRARAPALRRAKLRLTGERPADDDLPTNKVDVAPAERNQLAATESAR
jgi:hypothetical protein